jgi:hypothetical protein
MEGSLVLNLPLKQAYARLSIDSESLLLILQHRIINAVKHAFFRINFSS